MNFNSFLSWLCRSKLIYKLYIFWTEIYNFLKYRDRNFFRNVAIEISTKCNRKCSYCPNSKFNMPERYMNRKVFDKTIDRLKKIGFKGSLYFHFYNEPLLDKRLPELVLYSKKMLPKAMIRIFTNGDFLDEKKAGELIEAGVMEFVVTRHKPSSKLYLTRMTNLKSKFDNQINMGELDPKELLNRGGLIEVDNREPGKWCVEPLKTLQIDFEGNVILCCNDYFRKHKFGNILVSDLLSIWKNNDFKKIRSELRRGIVSLDICKKCLNLYD